VTHDQDEALTMSDRIAVFNDGRVEQVGSAAQIYENPASEFVAGFVGTSNLIKGEAAEKLLGRVGTFSVRPEKIHVGTDVSAPVEAGMESVKGTVAEVVYAGALTRFVVDLEAGARLVAVQQNLQTSSMDVLNYRNATVMLSWKKQHCIAIDDRS
jgi:putative spermidine/putrescine transport system ATP-binding protein